MPLIAKLIDNELASAAEAHHLLQAAQAQPGALDDTTVNRTLRVYDEQREMVGLLEGQLRRWAAKTLTAAQLRRWNA